jgi:hypothetical protein
VFGFSCVLEAEIVEFVHRILLVDSEIMDREHASPKMEPTAFVFGEIYAFRMRQVTGILRYELTDYEWAAVGPLLPTRPDGVARMR